MSDEQTALNESNDELGEDAEAAEIESDSEAEPELELDESEMESDSDLDQLEYDGPGLDVDWESLAVAVENQLLTSFSYLNLENGEVETLQIADGSQPDSPNKPGDWLVVPPRPSREGYRTMQHFVEQMEDPILRDKLNAALVGRGAFRRFKDLLLDFPEQRQEWFAFKDSEVYAYISQWLDREGVEVRNEPPSNSSRTRFSAAVRRSSPTRPALGDRPAYEGGLSGVESDVDWRSAIAPFDRPDVVFRPNSTALIVIDMQRIFVDPQGSSFLPMATGACDQLVALIQEWRQAGRPVIFTRHVHKDPRQDGGVMSRWWRSLIMDGSWGAEFVDDVHPADGERVITKSRYGAFSYTELEMVLRSMNIEDVLIGGVMTNLCCETTAREAFVRDFNVFLLADGTAAADVSLHLASLRNLAYGFGRVLSVAEAQRILAIGR